MYLVSLNLWIIISYFMSFHEKKESTKRQKKKNVIMYTLAFMFDWIETTMSYSAFNAFAHLISIVYLMWCVRWNVTRSICEIIIRPACLLMLVLPLLSPPPSLYFPFSYISAVLSIYWYLPISFNSPGSFVLPPPAILSFHPAFLHPHPLTSCVYVWWNVYCKCNVMCYALYVYNSIAKLTSIWDYNMLFHVFLSLFQSNHLLFMCTHTDVFSQWRI